MDLIPKFKKDNGLQKVHTVFLTDGASNTMHDQYHTYKDDNGEITFEEIRDLFNEKDT